MWLDLEQPSGERDKDKEENRPVTCVSTKDIEVDVHNKDGASVSAATCSMHNKAIAGSSSIGRASNTDDNLFGAHGMAMNSAKYFELHEGMEFESKEEAFSCYKQYAKSTGFTAIIKASRRSRISGKFIDAKFVCTRYGNKRESSTLETPDPLPNADSTLNFPVKRKRGRINRSWSKTDCKACMHVKRRQDGWWIICSFIKEHNHEIFPDQTYNCQGHRNIDLGNSNIDTLQANRARGKRACIAMSKQSGITKKVENKKHGTTEGSEPYLALEDGDAQALLEHFLCMQDENPNFFYALDLNHEQRLRNVLWVDPKSRLDYESFSDVVLFDTTYIKSEYKLPFVPFIGVNHHFQFLSFGCALIGDESKSTYVWLMQAWLRAMGGQAPSVILTDQDKMLKEAISEVFKDTCHRFCLWHVVSKIQEKLSNVIRHHENFVPKFNKCILKSVTEKQFEKRWSKLVERFDLKNDLWIELLYDDRQRWVPAYMKDIFLAGMSCTLRLENICSLFDKIIQRKTTLKSFLNQYKSMLQEKYEDEARAEFETLHKQLALKSPSPFGKQMATVYTHAIFKKFQVEVLGVVACHPKKEGEDGLNGVFKVQDFERNQDFMVVWNDRTSETSCSCRLFEYSGFLCRHVMIVLQMSGVHSIPSKYIKKRWTKDAKDRESMRLLGLVGSRVQRYNDICHRALKLGDEGSLSLDSYKVAFNALEEALRKCESVNNTIQYMVEPSSPSNHVQLEFEEVSQGNCTNKTTRMNSATRKGKVSRVISFFLLNEILPSTQNF